MSRADEFFGTGAHPRTATEGLDKMFPEGGLITTAPWPAVSRSRSRPRVFDRDTVAKELMQPPRPQRDLPTFDPRHLLANQPQVTREGVSHYMKGDYERTGRTFRDRDQIGNRQPVVYRRPAREGGTEDVILSGHHRAAAALLQGKQFRARLVEGP